MADFVKITHVANEVEADLLSQRLLGEGISSFSRQTGASRPKIYSGSLSAVFGMDIYVEEGDKDRARELIREWDSFEMDEQSLNREAAEANEIPEDVLEYLEQIKNESREPFIKRFYWSDLSKKLSVVLGIVVLIGLILLTVMNLI